MNLKRKLSKKIAGILKEIIIQVPHILKQDLAQLLVNLNKAEIIYFQEKVVIVMAQYHNFTFLRMKNIFNDIKNSYNYRKYIKMNNSKINTMMKC